jgi:hypothetical protein
VIEIRTSKKRNFGCKSHRYAEEIASMRQLLLTASAVVLGLSCVVMPVRAEAAGYTKHRARALPAHVLSRRHPYIVTRRQAPDFLIQAYLPRTTEAPIYNEPPSRFLGH